MPENRPQPQFRAVSDRRVPGVRRVIQVPNPASATDWQQLVPGGRTWRFVAGTFTLNTSATAGSRIPNMALFFANQRIWVGGSSTNMSTISSSYFLSFTGPTPTNAGNATAGSFSSFGVRDIWLPTGAGIGTVSGLQTGDTYTNIFCLIEELFEDEATILQEQELQAEQLADAIAGTPTPLSGL